MHTHTHIMSHHKQQPQQPQHQQQPQQQTQYQPQQQQQQQQHQHQQPRKKKVEWNSNQCSSEPQSTENSTGSPMWDSEADHMLSYFLDGNSPPDPPAQFPHNALSTNRAGIGAGMALSASGNRPVTSDRILQHPFRTNYFPGSAPVPSTTHSHNADNDLKQPPPTPVIQHYLSFSSSSSHKNASKLSSRNPGSSTISAGVQMPLQTHHFPFDQQQQQQQKQQSLDPIQAMKQNWMGACQPRFTSSAGSSNSNHFAFQGYNAIMEEGISPVSSALELGGDHEPLLLPGKKQRRSNSAMSSQINALAETYAQTIPVNAYGISSRNPIDLTSSTTVTANSNSLHPAALNKEHATVVSLQAAAPVPPHLNPDIVFNPTKFAQSLPSSASAIANPNISSQVAAHVPSHLNRDFIVNSKIFAESIPSSESAISNPNPIVISAPGGFPQNAIAPIAPIAPIIHPSVAAALVAGASANHPFFLHPITAAYLTQKAETVEETDEKRAKRLERNRESARKSRQRKKEHLSDVEEKASHMYAKIEHERRVQINFMDTDWKNFEKEDLLQLKELHATSHNNINDWDHEERLQNGLSRLFIGEKEQSILKEVVEFQYNSLDQHLLPSYQKYLLWMILQSESYFLSGKEEHSKRELSKKITLGKISSKQLGEEILNSSLQQHGESSSPNNQEQQQGNHMACVTDALKFWPLVCFELGVSVEQEERFLEAQGKVRQAGCLQRKASEIIAATRLASRAKECVLYQIHVAAFRKRKTYRDILTPRQAILYQEWLLSNRDGAKTISDRRKRSLASTKRGGFATQGSDGVRDEDLTLEKLCRYLEESLKVSKDLPR